MPAIIPPATGETAEVLLWAMGLIIGLCIAVIGFFLRQVITQVRDDRAESTRDRGKIIDALQGLDSKFDNRLDPIRTEIGLMRVAAATFTTWSAQHERLEDQGHADHGRRLDEQASRISYLERQESKGRDPQGR
jgi:hypothetical protein